MSFADLLEGAEFVLPEDPITRGGKILKKIKGRRHLKYLAVDRAGHEWVINPMSEVFLIESSKEISR
jgi:hypothetical protein